jgi:bifunctional DNA-binding transcriptional regulator/antitoxin component of YhaV-PrlF toxin-antitoxin module
MTEEALSNAYITRVDSRGRLILRKAIREAMGLPNGGLIRHTVRDDGSLVYVAHRPDADR